MYHALGWEVCIIFGMTFGNSMYVTYLRLTDFTHVRVRVRQLFGVISEICVSELTRASAIFAYIPSTPRFVFLSCTICFQPCMFVTMVIWNNLGLRKAALFMSLVLLSVARLCGREWTGFLRCSSHFFLQPNID